MCPEFHSFMLSLRSYCMHDLVGVGLLFCSFSFFLFNVSSSLVFKHGLVYHMLKKTSPFTHSFSVNLIQSSAPLKKEVCFHLLTPHVFKLSHFCFWPQTSSKNNLFKVIDFLHEFRFIGAFSVFALNSYQLLILFTLPPSPFSYFLKNSSLAFMAPEFLGFSFMPLWVHFRSYIYSLFFLYLKVEETWDSA